ncbi:MAG: hypothetical protein GEU77_15780 [Deltaproteobacteria bacterium]|nr:hypothetical protein [Deltaproteobacteria bacterium]
MTHERVLAIFPGALGDFICFLPALERLAERSVIDVLARTEFSDLAPLNVQVGSLERFEIRSLFVSGGSQHEKVRGFFESYAATYSWLGSRQAIFEQELSSATHQKVRLFPFRPVRMRMHQAEYYLSCLDELPTISPPCVRPKPKAVEWTRAYWEQNSIGCKPMLAIAPGSGAREKNWPVNSFEAVARWWRDWVGGVVMILLGPVEEERGGYSTLCRSSLVMRGVDLGLLAALLARCSLYIGNDSGTSHLAAAVGTPTVAVFGPSDLVQWAPRGESVSILTQNVQCSPCTDSTMKSCAHRKCLTHLEPTEVIQKLAVLPAVSKLTKGGAGIRVFSEISPESYGRTAG